jgi:death on curing protein
VAGRRRPPVWLTRLVVDAIHIDQIREHGGLPGLRDEQALESALARPRQKWHDERAVELPALAAAYAFGLLRNHPYRDGNKRVGFLAAVTFLGVNGYELNVSDASVITEIVGLAAGHTSEAQLAEWVRRHAIKLP